MRCYICDSETDRWPDSVCDACLRASNDAVRREDEELPEMDVFVPFSEAFEPDV